MHWTLRKTGVDENQDHRQGYGNNRQGDLFMRVPDETLPCLVLLLLGYGLLQDEVRWRMWQGT